MLTEADIEKLTREVVSGAEEEFITQLTAALVSDFVEGVGNGAASKGRLEELARANREHVQTILKAYQTTAANDAAAAVLLALRTADARSAKLIANHQKREARAATFQSELIAKQTAQGVAEIIKRQNVDLATQAERTWYEVTAQTLELANRGVLPRGYYEHAIMKLGRAGVYKMDYKSGRSNQIDVAIKRHVRTQASQAAARMEIERLADTGHNLVMTSAHFGARPEHEPWQGKAFSMTGRQIIDGVVYEDFYQQTGYGTVTGLCGANCRHHFGVYVPGMALPDMPETINGMTSDEYYAATQRQRELERRVRKTKREIASLDQAGVGLESPTYVQKRLVLGNQQKQLRDLCASKGLKREPYREKAYGIGKQPVALRSKSKAKAGKKPEANATKHKPMATNTNHTSAMDVVQESAPTVRESLISLKKGKNYMSVNRKFVNSKKFHDLFESLPYPKAVREVLYAKAGEILEAMDGTLYEGLVAVNARTGGCVADTLGRPPMKKQAHFTKEELARIADTDEGVILLHNHPTSTYPSPADIISAATKEKVKGSLVVCHDGDVYLIASENPETEKVFQKLLKDELEIFNDRNQAEIIAFSKLENENGSGKWYTIKRLKPTGI